LFQDHWFARGFLFAMSIPVAVVANIGRIVTIAIVARFWGQDLGMKIYHDYSGYLVFVLCVLLVMGLSALMDQTMAGLRRLRGGLKGRPA
jgi:exosortase/archaeosortase family protein